jgi:hypothetical protein
MVGLIIGLVVGLLGVMFGVRCYIELYRWARQCQGARIVVATGNKVQINAPLVEWLGWANQLEGDEATKGRVVYLNAKVKVAILKKPVSPNRPGFVIARNVRRVQKLRGRRTGSPAKAAA